MDRKLRVCIVTTAFPRWAGDAQGSFVWEAARAVCRTGAAVRVIAMHAPGAATHETLEGIEVIRPRYMPRENWEILRREGGGLPIIWRRNKLARLLFVPFGLAHVLAIARWARDCDVVHANWTLSALAAVLARPVHRRPVVATLQGSDIFQVTRSGLGRRLTAATLRACDRVLVLSRALAQATARTGIPMDRLTIVPNGVDTGRFTPAPVAEREPLILFVGSLIPRKGANHLIEAMPSVLTALPGYRLVMLGDGPDEQALREQAAALGIVDRIDMAGFLPQAEVVAAMRRARLFVLPSLEEGLGVVLLEALSCGTPIVASAVDGIVDVVTQEVGKLAPPAQPQALAEAITAVLSDDPGWQAMSRAARLRAEKEYDWDIIAARLVEIYRGVSG